MNAWTQQVGLWISNYWKGLAWAEPRRPEAWRYGLCAWMRYTRSNHGVARGGFEIEVRRMHIHQDSFLYPFVTLEHLLPSIFDKNLRPTRNSFQTDLQTTNWSNLVPLCMLCTVHVDKHLGGTGYSVDVVVFAPWCVPPPSTQARGDRCQPRRSACPGQPLPCHWIHRKRTRKKIENIFRGKQKKWRRSSSGSHSWAIYPVKPRLTNRGLLKQLHVLFDEFGLSHLQVKQNFKPFLRHKFPWEHVRQADWLV